jgi:peptidoglycan/LPS O-acetylase OafA/YrhL
MSGEGARNGYEHAGGYRPDVPLWPGTGEMVRGVVFVGLPIVGIPMMLGKLVPGEPARNLFFLLLCAVMFVLIVRDIFRASRLDPEEHVANPMSVLHPERIGDDAMARRRRKRIRSVLFAILALAGFAYCLQALLAKPVPLDQVPAVILLAAAFFLTLVLPGAYLRRRRRSSTE